MKALASRGAAQEDPEAASAAEDGLRGPVDLRWASDRGAEDPRACC